ncbi:CHAT domain-containing protein [Spongiivirga citrea]|uniref:CHAT domain-containing protein n=1 Tax=Spongiivirga citrea TaxID=1481457 RepID=A0A6M0CMA5_9FLAO|nr:CHAT domain-containing protein [Spongiivirga citrea]NER19068.1 CHAT domain-containing protein [Spongiivirga citrea]
MREAKIVELFYKAHPHFYSNKDSAYFFMDRALKLTDPAKDLDTRLSLFNWLITTSSYHYDLPRYNEYLNQVEAMFKLDSVAYKLTNYQAEKEAFILNRASYYFQLADYQKAKSYFQQLLTSYESININDHTEESIEKYISVISYLATIYRNKGKYDIAEKYYLKIAELINVFYKGKPEGPLQEAANDQLLAELYNRTGKYALANNLLHKSFPVYIQAIKTNAAYKNSVNTIIQKLAANQLKQDSITQALNTLNESQQYLADDDPFHRRAQLLYGDIYLKKGNYRQSKVFYDKALEAYKIYRNNRPHEDVANIYLKLAVLEKTKRNYPEALVNIQQALINATSDFSNSSFDSNPAPEAAFSKRQLLTILSEKLQLLELDKRNEGQTYEVSNQIINTLDKLKTEFESKLDKTFLIDQTYPVFHKIIQIAHKNYNKTKEPKYLQLAFLAMEKSKSILLLETIKAAEATKFGGVPDSILNIGQQYRANINYYEKKLFDAEVDQKQVLNDSLFKWNNGYIYHLASIEKEYPKYYRLKYDAKTATIEEAQTFLNRNETVINYHIADSVLYAMVVSKKEIDLKAIAFNKDLQNKIEGFYRKIASPSLGDNSELQTLSNEIYAAILKPVLDDNFANELIIIPDGVLSYIPFGVLNKNQDNWNYVINEYSIRYASSATLMTNQFQNGENKVKNKLLAFAPTFDEKSLYDLPYSKNEIDLVASHFDGISISGTEATLQNFNSTNNEYGLLHLATHASANDEFPDYSYLAFSPDEDGDKLYVKDLYNQTISANMVTLSACQTGIGKLQKGEGLLSIERGFMYAGAKSLTTTMWKNNDKTTSQLMDFYYNHLKKGEAKDIALQKAKLDYLNTTSDDLLKHPYYWAGFKIIGDASPVSKNNYWFWLFVALGSLSGILIYGKSKMV